MRLAFAIVRAAGIPFTLPDSISFTRRSVSSAHAASISLLVKSSTLSMIFSAKRIRELGGKSKTSFSNARIVMPQIEQKSRRRANAEMGENDCEPLFVERRNSPDTIAISSAFGKFRFEYVSPQITQMSADYLVARSITSAGRVKSLYHGSMQAPTHNEHGEARQDGIGKWHEN
jgi:hypothetical protein